MSLPSPEPTHENLDRLAHAVSERWADRRSFTVLATRFGDGAFFEATLRRWIEDPRRPADLFFVAIESAMRDAAGVAHGMPPDASLCPASADIRRQLIEQWPLAVPGLHRLTFAERRVTLTLAFGDAMAMLSSLRLSAEAVWLDEVPMPDLGEDYDHAASTMSRLRRLMAPDGLVLSPPPIEPVRSPDDHPRRATRPTGAATFHAPPARAANVNQATQSRDLTRQALIVGAGLAGCAIASALSSRGWAATLLDAGDGPARAGSGSAQPRCAEHLHLSPDDNRLARLSRAAWSLARRGDAVTQATRHQIGKLMIAHTPALRDHHQRLLTRLAMPTSFIRWVEAEEASTLAGLPIDNGAIWWPGCAVVDPAARCNAWLTDRSSGSGPAIVTRFGADVARIEREGPMWLALDDQGRCLGRAPVAILANAGHAVTLAGLNSVSLQASMGQSTIVSGPAAADLRCVLGGHAYALPIGDGRVLTGPSNHEIEPHRALQAIRNREQLGDPLVERDAELPPDQRDDRHNIDRLSTMLGTRYADPPLSPRWATATGGASGLRFAARDHLPLIGAVPDETAVSNAPAPWQKNDRLPLPCQPGLYLAAAFGGRGALWCTLAAEVLCAMIEDHPMPIERDLLSSIDPARFLRHDLRRAQRS